MKLTTDLDLLQFELLLASGHLTDIIGEKPRESRSTAARASPSRVGGR